MEFVRSLLLLFNLVMFDIKKGKEMPVSAEMGMISCQKRIKQGE